MPSPGRRRVDALRAWWRVTKTLQPGEPGTVRLLRAYGDQLVCVRYRTSGSGEERLTTVELVIDRTVIRKRGNQIVAFKIHERETRLRREALKLGAWFDAATGLWNLARHDVLHLGLRHRIAMPRDQMLREEASRLAGARHAYSFAEAFGAEVELRPPRSSRRRRFARRPRPQGDLMEPSIVTHVPFVVLGMQIDTRPMSPAIAELWSRFVQREHEITGVVEAGVSYGVMQSHAGEPDGLRYLAGLRVAEPSTPLPAGMSAVSIPGGLYAVFEFPFSEIGPAFDFMFNAWLPGSGFVAARSPMFERYGQDFDPSDSATRMQAHIPLTPKAAGD